MADEQFDEKTEDATEKRREDFRKRGQVAQSKEVQTAIMLTSMLVLWFFYLPLFWPRLQSMLAHLWGEAGSKQVTPAAIIDLGLAIISQITLLLAPMLLLVLIAGAISSIIQFGFLLTGKPLQPDFAKLNPIKGAAKFFSKRSMVEVVKSLAKVALVGYIAYKTVSSEFQNSLLLVDMPPLMTMKFLGRVAGLVLFKSCGVIAILAMFDFLFVKWELEQKMKMTKQEQKEEHKQTEGDPHIKSRIRSLQQAMARKRMMADVPTADVIITNPTHLSIALKYDREKMIAPQVVAKGADHLAMKIREIANANAITMVENVPVARALYKVDIGQAVPEELFTAVAEIMAHVYSLKGNG